MLALCIILRYFPLTNNYVIFAPNSSDVKIVFVNSWDTKSILS